MLLILPEKGRSQFCPSLWLSNDYILQKVMCVHISLGYLQKITNSVARFAFDRFHTSARIFLNFVL